MASHGKKRHTKRLAAPRALPIPRKGTLWLKTSKPGPHGRESSIPLVVLLRDLLKVCQNSGEAKKLLNNGQVLVDGRVVKDIGFQVGLMDVITLKEYGSFVILNKSGKLLALKTSQAGEKLCKIVGKQVIPGNKTQLALHDGRSIVVDKASQYSTGDTLKLAIPSGEIKAHLKLEKESRCYVFHGRHAGSIGSLLDIKVYSGITPSNALIKDENGNEILTLKDYVFVVDPSFKL